MILKFWLQIAIAIGVGFSIFSAAWVYNDIKKIGVYHKGLGPAGWVLIALFGYWLLPLGFIFWPIYYFAGRRDTITRAEEDKNRFQWPVGK